MSVVCAVAVGIVCGLAGCIPPALLFTRALRSEGERSVSVAKGLVAIEVSFLLQTAAVFVVYRMAESAVLAFGCAMVGSFLAFWGVESVRGLRVARAASEARGKEKE